MRGLLVGLLGFFGSTASQGQTFDPRAYKNAIAGRPSEVLVLGTPHLSGMSDRFRPEHLSSVLNKLASWKPDAIAIEALSGAQCDFLRRFKAIHPGTADDYCWDVTPAARATGLDVPAATAEVERMLAAWPTDSSASQRRRMAALFLAAGDRTSALVQWLRLAPADRTTGDGLDQALVGFLTATGMRRNEDVLIAATLAARLGLERVHPVDDHIGDNTGPDDPGFGKALERIWSGPATKLRLDADRTANAKLGSPARVLDLYRYYNAPSLSRTVFDSDFGAAARDGTPQQYGRKYLGGWETRNLRMVANIRNVLARKPGTRMLAIVGASHKGYYQAYLDLMQDVRLADTASVLR